MGTYNREKAVVPYQTGGLRNKTSQVSAKNIPEERGKSPLPTENDSLSKSTGAFAEQTDADNNSCISAAGTGAGYGTNSLTRSYKDSLKSRVLSKIPEGWHNTEKHGDVFVSPGGIAWVVQQQGNKLESVSVTLTKGDIIGKTAIEKRADAIRNQTRRTKSRVIRTQTSILSPGAARVVVGKVAEVVK